MKQPNFVTGKQKRRQKREAERKRIALDKKIKFQQQKLESLKAQQKNFKEAVIPVGAEAKALYDAAIKSNVPCEVCGSEAIQLLALNMKDELAFEQGVRVVGRCRSHHVSDEELNHPNSKFMRPSK